jgi:septal ring factor EnvC (AmiA/AmiB activator)
VGFSFIEFIDIQTPTFDEASRKREERNIQQRICRAEMSSEQREEMKRKQREYMRDYQARKKAKSKNSSTSCALTETVPTTTPMVLNLFHTFFISI